MWRCFCILFKLVFLFQGLASVVAMDIELQTVEQSAFLALIRDDAKLVEAANQAIQSFETFEFAMRNHERSTGLFIVVVFVPSEDLLVPVGIQVDHIDHESISGKLVLNDRHPIAGDRVSVSRRSVIDWRYIDTWRLVGGHFYRECESRIDRFKQAEIFGIWTQCVHPDIQWDDEDWQLTRDIVNGKTKRLARRFQEAKKATLRELEMVCHTGWRNPLSRREVCRTNVQKLVIAFSGPGVILSCGKSGWLNATVDVEKHCAPLMWTAATFNSPYAVSELLALGIPLDEKGDAGRTALMEACEFSTPEMVEHLLRLGADPNVKNENGETAVFCLRDPAMVGVLVNYGADFSVRSYRDRNCLSTYSNIGRIDIINALIDIGVRTPDGKLLKKYSEDEVASMTRTNANERARQVNRRAIEATESNFDQTDDFIKVLVERLRASEQIDYGAVLPLRAIDSRTGSLLN